jgi:hypothetical protein
MLTQTNTLTQDDSGASIRENIDDRFVIIESKLELTQKDIPYTLTKKGAPILASKYDVYIFADEVHISGIITNPGKNILIVTPKLSFSKDTTIDTSGVDGKGFKPDDVAHQVNTKANAKGANGAKGGTGLPPGNITIYASHLINLDQTKNVLHLIAKGGAGSQGQQGHEGMVGGLPGDPTNIKNNDRFEPRGEGSKGAIGGDSGDSGDGGPGGIIKVAIVNIFQKEQIIEDIAGGVPGPVGKYGANGGGPGAMPGPHSVAGSMGDFGRPGLPGKIGPVGKIEIHNGNSDFAATEFAKQIPTELMQIMQYQADLAYLNKDYKGALARYILLAKQNSGNNLITDGKPNNIQDNIRSAIQESAHTQLTRINQRLDFYGNAPDWVPVLTIQNLQNRVDQLLTLANAMEDSILRLENVDEDNNDHQIVLDKLQKTMKVDLEHQSTSLNDATAGINHQEKVLRELFSEVNNQASTVNSLKGQFKEKWEKDHEGCTIEHVCKVAQSIVKAIPEVIEHTMGMGKAAADFKQSKSAIDGLKNGIGLVKSVSSEYSSLKDAYNDIADSISSTKPDFAKMFVNEADFDAMIKNYLKEYALADELKAAVHSYFQIVQTRNTQVVNYNAMYLHQNQLRIQVKQRGASMELFAEHLAESQSNKIKSTPKILAFLKQSDAIDRLFLLSKVYEENKALEYWSLSKHPFDISRSIEGLREAHIKISQEIDTWKHYKGRPYSEFNDIRVSFIRESHDYEFATMNNTKHLIVRIPLDHPAFVNKFHVTVEELTVKLEGGKSPSSGILGVEVVHCGVSEFKTTGGETKHYSHQPRATYYEWSYEQKETTVVGTLGGSDQGYTGLSPFATWMIKFDLPGNEALQFNDIEKVELCFSGKMLGPEF